MSHPRKDIRDFVATLLTGATPAGARVYPSRALDLEQLKEPAIAVFDDSESVEDPEADYPPPGADPAGRDPHQPV